MRDFNEHNATAAVLERMANCRDERLKRIMTSVVSHLHAVVREVEPTIDEWMAAIRFLTETGQKCDDKRQEYILLSDTLGVSMLSTPSTIASRQGRPSRRCSGRSSSPARR